MDLAATFQPLFSLRSTQSTTISGGWFGSLFGATTKNGTPINSNSALTLSAFYRGIEVISNDYAKLPTAIYQKKDKDRIKKGDHPVQYLIATQPNAFMTAFMFDKMMVQHAMLRGNGYAEIIRDSYTSQPTALQLINQDETPVEVLKYKGKLYYKFDGRTVEAENMLHLPGFSFNGITGISVLSYAAASLGIALSSQEFGTDYYNSKGIGRGVATASQPMTPDAKIRYGEALGSALSGKGSDFKVAVADGINSFTHLKVTPQEAEFLAANKFGIEDVSRWLGVPLHKLSSTESINNSITENLELAYISDSIIPWAVRKESQYNIKLLTAKEIKSGYFIKCNEGALLRADKTTQAEYFSKLVNSKIMTSEEARVKLDLPFIEGTDQLLQPVNLMTDKQFNQKLEVSKISKTSRNE